MVKKSIILTIVIVLSMLLSSCDYLKYPKLETASDYSVTYNQQVYTEVDLPYNMEIVFSDSPIARFNTMKGYVLVYPSEDEEQSFLRGGTTWIWMKQGLEIPDIYDLTVESIYIASENREKIDLSNDSLTLLDISTESVVAEQCKTYNCIITVKEYDWIILSVMMKVDVNGNRYLCIVDEHMNHHYMKISEQYSHLFNVD